MLQTVVPQVTPRYPLSDLDGVNIWYEARLVEEGIEDMQNLATANLVDVILHTRVSVGRLVDWLDQAYLALHLPPRQQPHDDAAHDDGGLTRTALEARGIRTASDLIKAWPAPSPTAGNGAARRKLRSATADSRVWTRNTASSSCASSTRTSASRPSGTGRRVASRRKTNPPPGEPMRRRRNPHRCG